mgnify:CR=1 FL=1
MSSRVVVVGSINMDMFAMVSELPRTGETVLGNRFFSTVGGKGANQATAIARLSTPVSFVAKVGKDPFGEQMLTVLKENGIDTRFVFTDSLSSSGVALVNVDKTGENTIVVIPGVNQLLSEEDILKAQDEIAQARVLVSQLEIPHRTVETAFEVARRHKVKTILNPAPGSKLSPKLLNKVDVLTPNETELGNLFDEKITTEAAMKQSCYRLLDMGVKSIALTLGKEGVLMVSQEGFQHYSALKVKVVDTTGAGDAFTGGLAAFLSEGLELDQAVKKAIQVAGYSVTKLGAQPSLPTRMELEEFVRIVTGK